jgi:sugar phosphate isomerase/epimerase
MMRDKMEREVDMNRRRLLGTGVAALSMMALPGCAEFQALDRVGLARKRPGIQLYTVRAAMEQDVPGTLKAIAGMGYGEVEFAGYFDAGPAECRRMVADLGMTAPSGHVQARDVRDVPQKVVDVAAEAGHDYVTIGWLHPDDRQTISQYQEWATACNRIGELCKKAGMRFAYHNHDFEFVPIGGNVPYDVLMLETDPELVDFELDFYWVQRAGKSIESVLAFAPERFPMAHIKDMDTVGNMTDVGTGTIDFASILGNKEISRIKHLFAERDDAPDPFKSAAISHAGLQDIIDQAYPRNLFG